MKCWLWLSDVVAAECSSQLRARPWSGARQTVHPYGDAPNDGGMNGTHLNGPTIAAGRPRQASSRHARGLDGGRAGVGHRRAARSRVRPWLARSLSRRARPGGPTARRRVPHRSRRVFVVVHPHDLPGRRDRTASSSIRCSRIWRETPSLVSLTATCPVGRRKLSDPCSSAVEFVPR
jgi:hypothetical protein